MKVELTESEARTIIHALVVAAGRFREDATTLLSGDLSEGNRRLIEQFNRQIRECNTLRDKLGDL
jgi:hypothetical protein